MPGSLWARLRADPIRAPEHLALAAAEVHGPAATRWLAGRRAMYAYDSAGIASMVKRRHAGFARFEGAATGIGGFLTVLPDIAGLAWIQTRMVFFLAGAYGFDPLDPMRPAELLVLQRLYDDPMVARQALDGAGKTVAEAFVSRHLDRSGEEEVVRRLLTMVGRKAAKGIALRMIPGVAVPVNAIGNERHTRALADRAIAFYSGR